MLSEVGDIDEEADDVVAIFDAFGAPVAFDALGFERGDRSHKL